MFNNFVKSMMALCMVTSGWSSLDGVLKDGTSGNLEDLFEKANEEELLHKESDAIRNSTSSDLDSSNFSEGSIGTGEAKTECNGDSIVQSKVIDIIVGSVKGKGYADRDDGKNNEIKDLTAEENSEINTSNSSEGSIGPVDEATQTDEVGALGSPDLNSSNSSDGSIKSDGEEKQSGMRYHDFDKIDVIVGCGVGSETYLNSVNLVLEDLGSDGTDVENLEKFKILDEVEPIEAEKLNSNNKVISLINAISGANCRFDSGMNAGFCKRRIIESIKSLYDIKAISTNLPESYDLFLALHLSSKVWEKEKSLEHISSEIVRIAENYGSQSGNVLDAISVILNNLRD